jgi:uncharacterized protein
MSFHDDLWADLYSNKCLWITLLSWFIAQGSKVLIGTIKEKRFNFYWILGTGGMPSAHSATTMALAVSVGKEAGFNSPLFTLCFIFALVTMFDAQTWRRSIGTQAKILNAIVEGNKESKTYHEQRLKELVGHTPIEVFVGAVIGIAVPLFFYK